MLRKRIQLRGRAMEQDFPVSYLNRLDQHYSNWFRRYDLFKKIERHLD